MLNAMLITILTKETVLKFTSMIASNCNYFLLHFVLGQFYKTFKSRKSFIFAMKEYCPSESRIVVNYYKTIVVST